MHEQIGEVDAQTIRQAVAGGFPHYIAVLQTDLRRKPISNSCVDLMDILAFHDRSLAGEAIAALQAAWTGGRAPALAMLIDNTLDDLA